MSLYRQLSPMPSNQLRVSGAKDGLSIAFVVPFNSSPKTLGEAMKTALRDEKLKQARRGM